MNVGFFVIVDSLHPIINPLEGYEDPLGISSHANETIEANC